MPYLSTSAKRFLYSLLYAISKQLMPLNCSGEHILVLSGAHVWTILLHSGFEHTVKKIFIVHTIGAYGYLKQDPSFK